MTVVVSMLRGVNVGGNNMIRMDALRRLYESLKLRDAQTYVQSGNVIFKAEERGLPRLGKRIEDAIESSFGFRPDVIIRTPAELRGVIARNPFAARQDIDPKRLLVTFLSGLPNEEGRTKLLNIKADPEELHIDGREVYVYFPNGIARPKLPWATIGKLLKTPGTGRNWTTVNKLLEIAEKLEAHA